MWFKLIFYIILLCEEQLLTVVDLRMIYKNTYLFNSLWDSWVQIGVRITKDSFKYGFTLVRVRSIYALLSKNLYKLQALLYMYQ